MALSDLSSEISEQLSFVASTMDQANCSVQTLENVDYNDLIESV